MDVRLVYESLNRLPSFYQTPKGNAPKLFALTAPLEFPLQCVY